MTLTDVIEEKTMYAKNIWTMDFICFIVRYLWITTIYMIVFRETFKYRNKIFPVKAITKHAKKENNWL